MKSSTASCSSSCSDMQLDEATRIGTKTRSGRCVKSNSDYMVKHAKKRQHQDLMYAVKKVLKKCADERTQDDNDLLSNCSNLVEHIDRSAENRLIAQAHQEIILDDPDLLVLKVNELANKILTSKQCVFYTGAGISTSASIPDYRGPDGLWTQLEKGVKVDMPDFSTVTPTYSHMALNCLMQAGFVKHVVSQNCDGLHVRSGLDRSKLSELHGNCFIEFCTECNMEYMRLFDVTERSSFRKHVTGRFCSSCSSHTGDAALNSFPLRDSIIHFGEKLRNGSPYNWDEAREAVKHSDLIVCLGTSLKVLRHYACLWPKKKSSSLHIVNIQWTPKDKQAKLKINAYCDQVMKMLIENLSKTSLVELKVNEYSVLHDPIFKLSVQLNEDELKTTSKSLLADPALKLEDIEASSIATLVKSDSSMSNTNSWFNKSFKPRKTTQATEKKCAVKESC